MSRYKLSLVKRRFASIYKNLMGRCYPTNGKETRDFANPKNGGIDEEWLHSKSNFICWCLSKNPPEYKSCLTRIDKNKPYGPDNCIFIPINEQVKTLPNNHWIEYKGERMIFSELIRKYSVVSRAAVLDRLRRGFSLEEALTTPSRKKIKPIKELQSLKTDISSRGLQAIDINRGIAELRYFLYIANLTVNEANKNWKLIVKKAKHMAEKLRIASMSESFSETCEEAIAQMNEYSDLILAATRYKFRLLFIDHVNYKNVDVTVQIAALAVRILCLISKQKVSLIRSLTIMSSNRLVLSQDEQSEKAIEITEPSHNDLFYEMLGRVWPLDA